MLQYIDFAYGKQGRRIRKTVWDNAQGTNNAVIDLGFAYDGLQCIAEMNATNNTVLRSYVWGLDLSGTQTEAGGVGGLLIMNDVQNGTHFYGYDGNGNVALMVNGDNGKESANFEYGPFGEVIKQTGLMSKINPFRFSTKRTVDSIDIILYEYRSYSPTIGRWLSRDPIGEKGGVNLYGFTLNNPIILLDTDGLFVGTRCPTCGEWYQGFHNCSGPSANGGPGFHNIPYWFEHPTEEGKPCCCKPQAKLKKFQRVDDPPTRTQLSMKMDVELDGCFKDLAKGWWTCWRPDGSAGWMPGFENQDNAKLNVFGITIPGVGGLSTGPHITIAYIRYLSCENGKWVKHKESSSRTYVWENGKWTW